MKNLKIISFLILLIGILLITFYPCLNNDFVNWDDDKYIFENNDIQNLTVQNMGKIFSSFYGGAYVPLTVFSFAVDYKIGGLNPLSYHRTNLILHIINAILIFFIVHLFCKRIFVSFLTALFFAIHPLHVEPVAWVSGRKDLVYALFFTGSLFVYFYSKISAIKYYYFISFLLFIAALLSKPVAITLPLVILAFECFLYQRSIKKSIICIVPHLIISIIFFYIAVIAQKTAGAFPQERLNFLQQINLSLSNLLFYFYKMFVPLKLSCIYPIQNYWFAPFVILLIIIIVLISLRYNRIIALTMVLFVIMMLPVLQLFPVGQILSDRYTYLSLTGFFYLAGAFVDSLYFKGRKFFRIFVSTLLIIVIAFLSFLSNKQCRVWKDGMALWTNAINHYTDIPLPYNSRGIIHSKSRNYKAAIDDFSRALQLNPAYVKAYVNRGNIYSELGDGERALSDYNNALEIDSTYLDAYHNRAVFYFNAKKYRFALKDLLRIKELGGDVPDQLIYYMQSLAEQEH